MLRLSRQQLWVALEALAGGLGLIGLIAILAGCLPPTTVQEAESLPTAMPIAQAPTSTGSGPAATDRALQASLPTSTATDTAAPTSTRTARPTATLTPTAVPSATARPSATATEAPTATPQPTATATLTPAPTAPPLPTPTPGAAAGGGRAIIIDHTCTDIGRIPDPWLAEAKKLAILYAHTSHGQQIVDGAAVLRDQDPRYGYGHFYAGPTLPRSFPSRCDGVLCIYDAQPSDVAFWSTEEGRNQTRLAAATGLFDVAMWSWCGEQSTNQTSTVQLYLDTMRTFEQEHPGMRFVLMTGHTDGGGKTLQQNNDRVRQYARDRGMVLFDFADIESHDPDGNYYPYTDDGCSWCAEWCTAHPEDCTLLPDSCPHSHPFNCMRKAYAFWWMMARLAGWDGS